VHFFSTSEETDPEIEKFPLFRYEHALSLSLTHTHTQHPSLKLCCIVYSRSSIGPGLYEFNIYSLYTHKLSSLRQKNTPSTSAFHLYTCMHSQSFLVGKCPGNTVLETLFKCVECSHQAMSTTGELVLEGLHLNFDIYQLQESSPYMYALPQHRTIMYGNSANEHLLWNHSIVEKYIHELPKFKLQACDSLFMLTCALFQVKNLISSICKSSKGASPP